MLPTKLIRLWLLPLLISIGLFLVIRPTLAQEGEQMQSISDFLTNNDVEVGEEVVGGFSRVYYTYNDSKIYVSPEGRNSKHANTKGEYIVWVSEISDAPGQIFLYHIPTANTVQLTNSGASLKPKVSKEGKVVWEGWVGEKWQVFLFDGTKVKQITDGDASFDLEIEGDFISFTRRDITDTYRAVVYSITKKEVKEVTTGASAKHPRLKNGKIFLADGTEEFPLTVEDLFTLDLAPLTSDIPSVPETVTVEEILQELEATPSVTLEEVSPTQVPESSPSPTSTPLPEISQGPIPSHEISPTVTLTP